MINALEQRIWQFLKTLSPRAHEALFKRRIVLKYLIAGGSAVAVNIGTLYLCKDIWGFALNPAVVTGFLAGFFVSFTLQKFWTFEDSSVEKTPTQAGLYFILALINFFLNLALMNFFVEGLRIWHILAQFLVSGTIAFGSFFVYKHFIFRQKHLLE